jgi:2-dehydro-3-deoxygluconokinase
MAKVLCLGELLLRFSPVLQGEWLLKNTMPFYIGGAELNVAQALAKWNIPVRYFTAMPDNYINREIIEQLKNNNIDTSAIHLCGSRIGSYYLPQGADLGSDGVVYDRAYSSFSTLQPGMIDWNELFNGCSWFHLSAINPALNENIAAVCTEALQAASAKNITVSIDLNYRSKLWQYGKKPTDVMPDLFKYCNVAMGNVWAVESLLGIPSAIKQSTGKKRNELIDAATESMQQLQRHYRRLTTMAYTFRTNDNYFGVLQHGAEQSISADYPLVSVVDKAGSGDCFMGGLIYGVLNKMPSKQIIDFASAAASGKLYEKGDSTNQIIEQVKARMKHG